MYVMKIRVSCFPADLLEPPLDVVRPGLLLDGPLHPGRHLRAPPELLHAYLALHLAVALLPGRTGQARGRDKRDG